MTGISVFCMGKEIIMQSKTKKAFRNVLAFLTVLTMMLGMLPTTLLAANKDDSGTAGKSGMHLSKTAHLEDDGTYTINLEAYATGTTTTTTTKEAVPLDIVLVLDQSGSMAYDMGSGYLLDNKVGYSYNDIKNSPQPYYYLDTDGNYYEVKAASNGWSDNRTYSLYYKKSLFKYYYLNSTEVSTTKPNSFKDATDVIWNGQLYSYSKPKSRLTALKAAVSNFVNVVKEKAETDHVNHRIAMVGFASRPGENGNNTEILSVSGNNSDNVGVEYNSNSAEYENAIQNAFQDTSTPAGNTMLNDAINALDAKGATRADLGMTMAKSILDKNEFKTDSKRKQLVIMFTDGSPTDSNGFEDTVANATISVSKNLKTQGTTVYTIGIFEGADPASTSTKANKYMNYVSTNYPLAENLNEHKEGSNKGYYLAASSADGLNEIFESISNTITTPSTTVALNENAVMKDILSDDFTLPEGYNAKDKISISTVFGSTADGNDIKWGTEKKSADIKATTSDNTINVTGFNYSQKYIAPEHDGEKLVVTIKGVIPKDSAATGEKVYTNNEASGIYAKGATEPAAEFPRPQVVLTNKAYVLDYAKPVTLSPSDWKMSSDNIAITGSIGEKDAGYAPESGYGSLKNLVYSPKTTNWDGYDKFYAFGKTTDDNTEKINGNKNLWSRVSVLPANNVYYEDDFETNEATETVGIEYTGKWSTVSSDTESANTESANTEIHGGWKNAALADDTKYSDGSAHMADADDKGETGKAATATFTFSGTGVDIYSHTNVSSGRVSAILKSVNADGEKTVVKALIMDNKSVGDYYQIPTLSFGPLEYGKYEVKLVVAAAGRKETTERRSTYYLDGIRVYHPIKDKETDTVVEDAYGMDMLNATFKEVRDILLDTGTAEGNLAKEAVVFLDRTTVDKNTTSNRVAEFRDYGPKNEVYLAAGQKIAFEVTNSNVGYYVGLKAPKGNTKVRVTNNTDATSLIPINHSTDLYYKITPVTAGEYKGCILIENKGNNLLSITKIYYNSTEGGIEGISDTVNTQSAASSTETVNEVTTPAEAADAFDDGSQFTDASDGDMPEAENTDLFAAEAEEVPEAEESVSVLENPLVLKLVEYANVFDTLSEVPYEDKTVEGTPDSGQDENTEVTEPDDGNVDITNPEPNEDQKPIDKIHSWLNKLFQGFNGWL